MKSYFFLLLTWLSLAGGGAAAQRSPQRAARPSRSTQATLQARTTAGPNLDRVEYFLDDDPGLGNATSVALGAASDNISGLSFAVPLGSLNPGLHRLGVRSRDLNSKWSQTAIRRFYYENRTLAANIDEVEYFLDNDPGLGNAPNASITPGANLNSVAITVDMSSVNQGLHRLWVRSHDAGTGTWSLSALKTFYYQPPTAVAAGNIDRVEYFLDTDPGIGSATAVSITPGTNLPSVGFAVDMSSVSQGVHKLYVRSHDAGLDRWSLTALKTFYYQPPIVVAAGNIDRVEYFLDSDPGIGQATAVSIAPAANISPLTFAVDMSSVSQGVHKFYVRSHDAGLDRWSLTALQTFYYQPPITLAAGNIDRVEYFLDNDPGVGSATAVSISPAANLPAVSFSVNLNSLSRGVHKLYVRSHDAGLDRWSLTAHRWFLAEVVPALANMNKVEYYYDADPGIGQGVDVPVSSPALDLNGFPFVADISALSAGPHRLYVRSRDASGKWSLTGYRDFVRPATVAPAISSFTPTVGTGGTVVTVTGSNFLGATGVTFNGVAGTGLVVNSATSITVTAPAGGSTGQVCVVAPAGTGCSSAAQNFTYTPLVTGITPTTLCAGSAAAVTFSASGYAAGNLFTAQLSNSAGSFASGVTTLGTLSGANGGTINGTVPAAVAAGSSYRIRVVADNPAATGADNGTNLLLQNVTIAAATANSPVQSGATIQLNVTNPPAGATYAWSGPGTFSNATLRNPTISNATTANSGTYQVVVSANGCSVTRTVNVTVNPPVVITLGTVTPLSLCAGSSTQLTVPFTVTGGPPTSGNQFILELSDPNGSFASGVTLLAMFGATGSSTFTTPISSAVATSTHYRVRVRSTTPAATSADNGQDITITAPFTVTATAADQSVSVGDPIALGVSGAPAGATYAWTGPNSFSSTSATPAIASATAAANGTYNVTVTNNGTCTATSSVYVRVTDCAVAATNVGAGLPAANYSQVGVYQSSTSQSAWNGGGWNAGGFSGNMTVDFGGPVTLTRLDLKPTPSPTSSVNISVQVSSNMTAWTTVATVTGTFATGAPAANERSLNFGASPIANVRGIRLVASYGQSWVSITNVQAFVCPMPYISSFTPAAGPAGTTVVLSGGNFTGATSVTFNGVSASGFTVDNAGQITVTAPAGGSTGPIAVTTIGGTGTSATSYTYQLGIAAGPISPATYCAGNAVSVPFTVTNGALNAGNVFTAQLSDASGSFASPVNIGSVSGTTSGTISGTMPAATATGTGYRIRVVASAPATTGSDNGANLTVTNLSAVVATSNSPLLAGNTIQLGVNNAPAGATFAWTGPGTFSSASAQNPTISNATTANSGTYQVVVSSNGCQVTRTVNVTVNNAPGLVMGTFGGSLCGGQSFGINFAATGSAFNAGNSVTAQLSDASGSFAVPTTIGSLANVVSTGNYSLGVTIPTSTPTGAGYRIRLVASSPAAISNDNGSGLSITTQPAAVVASNNSPVTYNGTITLTAQTVAGASYMWLAPGNMLVGNQQTLTISNATPSNNGTYTLVVTVSGCQNSTTTSVTVSPSTTPILTMAQFGGTLCAGTGTVNFSFNVTGNSFAAGNAITAQLSDASGSFAAPVNVGSVSFSGQGSGGITASIPGNTPQGSGYRIRLVGSNPAVTSQTDNGSNLTINAQPAAVVASNNSPVAYNGTITLTAQAVAGASYLWLAPGNVLVGNQQTLTIANATPANNGTYTLQVIVGSCGNTTTTSVTVSPAPAATVATGSFGGSYCPGSMFTVPFTVGGSFNGGNVFTAQLSSASGSFASPVNIGSVSGTTSGSVAVTIPMGTASGTGYRIRVVASSPATVGSDNGQNLTVGAISYTWTGGAGNTDWFNAQNWSCGQVPGSTSVVLIPSGLSFYPIITGGTASVYHITVQNTASLTINSSFHLYGNATVNGTVTGSASSNWYFYGTGNQFLYGSQPLQVGNLYINAGSVFNQQNGLNLYGSWYNNGGYVGSALYGVGFNGSGTSQCVCGSVVTSFYNFSVSALASVSLGINAQFLGNLAVNGTFNSTSWAVVFDGAVAQTIGGMGNTTFNNITINNTVGVTLVDDVTIRGNWINNGQFNPSTYAVVFAGTAAQIIGGTVVTNFYHVTFNNLISVTLNQHIYVLGNFINTGVFYGYNVVGGVPTGYWVRFGGSAAQVINASASTYFWHFYVDNLAGVSLATNIHIAGNYYLYSGSFNPGTYVCDFNGLGGYEQTVGGYTGLTFYGWNIVSGTTVRLNQHCTWLGGIVNAGDFYGYTLVGGVYTGYTCFFGGNTAQALGGSGNYYFWHVNIQNTLASVTFNTNVHVYGNWLNNGVWNCSTYTVFFDGPQAQLIGGSQISNFYHVTINNLISVTLNQNIYVLGNWGGTGHFFGPGYYVYFNGSAAQTVFSSGTTRFGTVRFGNPASVTLLSNLYLTGNWTHDGGFVGNGHTVYFAGNATQLIGGTATTSFHHVNIMSGATVQINRTITLLGNWLNHGSFLHNNLLVYFNGTVNQFIGGTSITRFYDIRMNNPVNVSLSFNIDVVHNFINEGAFCGCGYLVQFNGTVPQTITCTSTQANFHHLTFNNAQGVTLLNNIAVTGNWVNNGGYIHGGQTVYFTGTAPQTIGGSVNTGFHGWHNTNVAGTGVSLLQNVSVAGNWVNNGHYCGCGFTTLFNGSAAQALTCSTGQSNFHHLTLANTSTGGVTLTGNINVLGNWLVSGGWHPQTYTVFFTGTAAQSIGLGGSVSQALFHHLTIANTSTAGVTLGLNTPLWLTGNFTNNGTFQCGTNGVWANGTSLQTFGGTSPTTFYDWTVLNPAGVSCTGTGGTATVPALGIQHVLTMATGSGNLACGGNLTLLSNAQGTAMVVNQPGGGICTGVAAMQSFISASGATAGYRHYSSPMKLSAGSISTTVQEFADDLPVFNLNPAYNTVGNSVTPFPTLFKYEEGRLSSTFNTFDRGWMVPAANEDLQPLRGYSAQTNANTLVDISGQLQNGPVSYTVTRGSTSEAGWQLLGNPYPAPIDWDVVRSSGMLTGVADALYVHKPTGRYTGSYASYVNGIGQNEGGKDLASMQGFFVRATAPTGSVSFTNAVRHTSYIAPTVFRPGTQQPASGSLKPIIRLEARTSAGLSDEAVIYFEAGAGLGFSPRHDAHKVQLNGEGRPSLWSVNGTESLAINGLPELAAAPVIPLGVRVSQSGQHTLVLTGLADAPAGTQVWLEDRVLNRRQNLATNGTYAFQMDARYTGQRFFLSFVAAASPLAATNAQLEARTALYPNPTAGQVQLELSGLKQQGALKVDVVNTLGQVVLKASAPAVRGTVAQTLDLSGLPTGIYSVRVHAQEGTVVKRLVKE